MQFLKQLGKQVGFVSLAMLCMFSASSARAVTYKQLFANQSNPGFSGVCRDPWVTGAVSKVTGKTPNGQDDRGECNIRLYGNGHWSSYEDLVKKVKKAFASFSPGVCRDPWVTGAVSKVTGKPPKGYGEVGECDMYLYGNGYWSDYPDLANKVRATLGH